MRRIQWTTYTFHSLSQQLLMTHTLAKRNYSYNNMVIWQSLMGHYEVGMCIKTPNVTAIKQRHVWVIYTDTRDTSTARRQTVQLILQRDLCSWCPAPSPSIALVVTFRQMQVWAQQGIRLPSIRILCMTSFARMCYAADPFTVTYNYS